MSSFSNRPRYPSGYGDSEHEYEELDRVSVIERVTGKRLTQREAARMLGLTRRQVRRLCRAYGRDGPCGLASKHRGRPSNRRLSVETLRHWMTLEGLWVPRAHREPRGQQPRRRRPCRGELIQIDGCDHEWFEERAGRCTLLVFVDDATRALMELPFAARGNAAKDHNGPLLRDSTLMD